MKELSVRTTTRVVEQYGRGLAPRAGCEAWELDGADEQRFHDLLAQPNGGITLSTAGALAALPVPAPTPDPAAPQRVADAQTCKAYLAEATPTAAQTVAATKALIRLMRRVVGELAE